MGLHAKHEYNEAKATVKAWEREYRALNACPPDRRALAAASSSVRAAYHTFFKLRSVYSAGDDGPDVARDNCVTALTDTSNVTMSNTGCNTAESGVITTSSIDNSSDTRSFADVTMKESTHTDEMSARSVSTVEKPILSSVDAFISKSAPALEKRDSLQSCHLNRNKMKMQAPSYNCDDLGDGTTNEDDVVWGSSLNRAVVNAPNQAVKERAPLSDLYSKLAENMRASFLASPTPLARASLKKRFSSTAIKKNVNTAVKPSKTVGEDCALLATCQTVVDNLRNVMPANNLKSDSLNKDMMTHADYSISEENSMVDNSSICESEIVSTRSLPVRKYHDEFFDAMNSDGMLKSSSFKVKTGAAMSTGCAVNISAATTSISARLAGKINSLWMDRCINSQQESDQDVVYDFSENGARSDCVIQLRPAHVTSVNLSSATRVSPDRVTPVSPNRVIPLSPGRDIPVCPDRVISVSPDRVISVCPDRVTPARLGDVTPARLDLTLPRLDSVALCTRFPLLKSEVYGTERNNPANDPFEFCIPNSVGNEACQPKALCQVERDCECSGSNVAGVGVSSVATNLSEDCVNSCHEEDHINRIKQTKRKERATLEELENEGKIIPVWPPPKRKRVSKIVKNSVEEIERHTLNIKAKRMTVDTASPKQSTRVRVTRASARRKKTNIAVVVESPALFQQGLDDLISSSVKNVSTSCSIIVNQRKMVTAVRRLPSKLGRGETVSGETFNCEVNDVSKQKASPSNGMINKLESFVKDDVLPMASSNKDDEACDSDDLIHDYDEQLEMEKNRSRTGYKKKFIDKNERLMHKLNSGTINENYVTIDLKKKTFVRGKKFMTGSKYRRLEWKRKQGLKTAGHVKHQAKENSSNYSKKLTCFKCGDFGHWASKCRGKTSHASVMDEENRPPVSFLTLEEAADMAKGIKSNKTSNITRVYAPQTKGESFQNSTSHGTISCSLETSSACDSGATNLNDKVEECMHETSTESSKGQDQLAGKLNVSDNELDEAVISQSIPHADVTDVAGVGCVQSAIEAFENESFDDSDFNDFETVLRQSIDCNTVVESNASSQSTSSSQNSYANHRKTIDPLLNKDLTECPQLVLGTLKMFGHSNFRPGQEQAIMRILQGKSTLLVLSTGSGKSLCYQLPAYLYAQKQRCITLCVSPLVSLMEDQVTGLPAFLNAVCLHTNQTPQQRSKSLQAVRDGKAHILLVSPEAVVASGAGGLLGTLMKDLPPVAFACVDEAHCVSQWSHNFRPSYLRVCHVLRQNLSVRTILGLTATARHETTLNIAQHLHISCDDREMGIIRGSSVPPNLQLSVSRDGNRAQALIELLQGERFGQCDSIIVYCTRRDECERVATLLRTQLITPQTINVKANLKRNRALSFDAEAYHAGLSAHRRRQIQNKFMSGMLRIVVATVAFGMGINKSDVRAIIHYNMPKNLESYVQEIGRAGRDGRESHCHLFLDSLDGRDVQELKRFIFVNSVDRVTVRKLLDKVFVPCVCTKLRSLEGNICSNGLKTACPQHECALPVAELVEQLDLPEENVLTLLCYLELRGDDLIRLLPSVYSSCTVTCYGGASQLSAVSKTCPPLAVAIAKDNQRGITHQTSNTITFPVVQIAAEMGWNSGVVKKELKAREWTTVGGTAQPSGVKVEFSDLAFHLMVRGDLSDDERDRYLDELHARALLQETDQLQQLQYTHQTLRVASHASILLCTDSVDQKRCSTLKEAIGRYFAPGSSELEKVLLEAEPAMTTQTESSLRQDVRSLLCTHTDQTWTGRAVARVFHGIQSPNFPASVWGRVRRVWRAHISVPFKHVLAVAQQEIIKYRKL